MRDYMRYVNHYNEVFVFGTENVLINTNDFRNYAWTYKTTYNKISSFDKALKSSSLPVIIVGTDAKTTANRLYEIIEKDVIETKPGRMYIGNYYIEGFFYANKKKAYTTDNVIEITLSFASDSGFWVKETNYIFRINDEGSGGEEYGMGYAYGFPYGLSSPISSQNLVNTSFAPANAIIKIFGSVTNPNISIGGNHYQINKSLNANEIITINTKEKTAILTDANGNKSSVFALRNLDYYLFEKIKTGSQKVICNPECNIDVVLLDERSEPLWT